MSPQCCPFWGFVARKLATQPKPPDARAFSSNDGRQKVVAAAGRWRSFGHLNDRSVRITWFIWLRTVSSRSSSPDGTSIYFSDTNSATGSSSSIRDFARAFSSSWTLRAAFRFSRFLALAIAAHSENVVTFSGNSLAIDFKIVGKSSNPILTRISVVPPPFEAILKRNSIHSSPVLVENEQSPVS